MKNLKMKNFLLAMLCVGCVGATAVGVTQVVANAQTSQTAVIVAEKLTTLGASVRLSDVTGIRFSYAVEDYDAEANAKTNYGMLIVPYDYLDKAGIREVKDGVDYVNVLQEAYKNSDIPNQPIVKTNLQPTLSVTDKDAPVITWTDEFVTELNAGEIFIVPRYQGRRKERARRVAGFFPCFARLLLQ